MIILCIIFHEILYLFCNNAIDNPIWDIAIGWDQSLRNYKIPTFGKNEQTNCLVI